MLQTIYDKIIDNVGDKYVYSLNQVIYLISVPLIIVGNKLDLQYKARMVTTEEGQKCAIEWKADFVETSAKDNTVIF